MLLSDQVKHFNIIGIYNLNLDLEVLEAFAHRCPITNLAETFSEIRQVRCVSVSQTNVYISVIECLTCSVVYDLRRALSSFVLVGSHSFVF